MMNEAELENEVEPLGPHWFILGLEIPIDSELYPLNLLKPIRHCRNVKEWLDRDHPN